MTPVASIILRASTLALMACLLYRMLGRGQTGRIASAIALGVAVAVFALAAPASAQTRGPIEEVASVVFCYICMLLGMMAEYGYAQAERGRRRFKFEPMTFLMPIFASPIVFIPLLTLTTDQAIVGGAFTRAKLMVYLVAFQNGFFWKGFFEQRRAAGSARIESRQPQTT